MIDDHDPAWLELRVAAQFDKPWERFEDHLIDSGLELPSSEEETPDTGPARERHSAAHWMEQVATPKWFPRVELGLGTDHSILDTLESLDSDNARRREQYSKMESSIAAAREVLKRNRG